MSDLRDLCGWPCDQVASAIDDLWLVSHGKTMNGLFLPETVVSVVVGGWFMRVSYLFAGSSRLAARCGGSEHTSLIDANTIDSPPDAFVCDLSGVYDRPS